MVGLPEELLRLIEQEEHPGPERAKGPDELLIDDVAHLLYPLAPKESPRTTDERNAFIQRHRRALSKGAFTGGEDVLLDQLRLLRRQRDETDRRIRLLVAYARTTPPTARKYRLRDLSEAIGLPISSVRGLITDTELRALEQLDLDDDRAEALAKALPQPDDK